MIHNAAARTKALEKAMTRVPLSISIGQPASSTIDYIGKKIPSARMRTNPAIAVMRTGSIIAVMLSTI